MRIVDVCAFYTPHGGGVRSYVERKLTAGASLGHEIVVIAPGAEHSVTERGPGAWLVTIPAPQLAVDRRYRYFGDEKALHRALDEWRPDFVEASSPWSSASMVARWDGSAPRSLVMHADPLAAYAYRWFGRLASIETIDRHCQPFWEHLRRLSRSYDQVVCANGELARRLSEGGVRNVVTNAMGVEPGIFSPAHKDSQLRADLLAQCGLPASATLLVGVGRYSSEKRWDMVIDAALAAGNLSPTGLILIGDGRQRRRLTQCAAGSPHIIVGDAIKERAALAAVLASADALVHGCEAETFCMVGAEARASGLPIIAPDRGGAADHVDPRTGKLYRAADPRALRDAIVEFADGWPRPLPGNAPVRTMDRHFAELFASYSAIRDPMRVAA